MDTLKWGTDYLLRTLAKQKARDGDKFPVYLIAYQVGNYTLDNSRWERPEMIKDPRPVYYVTTRNGELARCIMPCVYALWLRPIGLASWHWLSMRPAHYLPLIVNTECHHCMLMIRQPE